MTSKVVALNTGGLTPEAVADWLISEIELGTCEQVLVVTKHRTDVADETYCDWQSNGDRGNIYWLASWCVESMRAKWFR